MRETVHRTGRSSALPKDIWTMARNFTAPWHPAIAWMEREAPDNRSVTRRFGVAGDDGVYRERLTYLSHSDHILSYELLAGIEGARQYAATLNITAGETGSLLTWQADIDADAARARAIADGTAMIFDAGIEKLAAATAAMQVQHSPRQGARLGHQAVGPAQSIAVTVAPAGLDAAETICLFLHGIGGNRRNWDKQLAAIGNQMPAIAMDLRGYGDSAAVQRQSRLDDYFDDIQAVMDRFGARNVILCGLSYGAWIAAGFALRHPGKVAGLVLNGGCTGMSEADPQEREAFRTSREVPLNAGKSPADFAPDVVNIIAGPDAGDGIRAELAASMEAISRDTYRDALICFTNPPGKLDFSRGDFPVLLMTGEHDRLAPPDEIRQISRRFADAAAPYVQFEVIAGAGHVCNLEAPDVFNRHLTDFLELFTPVPMTTTSSRAAKKAAKRQRILDAALAEFAHAGYSGASMQAIADRAGVSKPTLYQYIGQKAEIFRTILVAGRTEILSAFDGAQDRDMVDVLWGFAWSYTDYVMAPDNLSIQRLIIGEAQRVPEVVRQFVETGPAMVLAGIVDFLENCRNKGDLSFADAAITAEHLWSLILSGPRTKALHFPDDLPNDDDLIPVIRAGLAAFIRAYAQNPDPHLRMLEDISQYRPTRRLR